MVVSQALAEIRVAPPRALLSEETGDHLLCLQAIFSCALSLSGGHPSRAHTLPQSLSEAKLETLGIETGVAFSDSKHSRSPGLYKVT